jgi:hypothetical protein
MRLWLIGDDEVLDLIADFTRHLDYEAVSRVDALPDAPFDEDDHVLVAQASSRSENDLVAHARTHGDAAFVGAVPPYVGKGAEGKRAILAAAALIGATTQDDAEIVERN